LKITVLAGGLSPERDVSLVSGSLIARALTERGHKALLVDVYEGIDIKNTELDALFENAEIPEFKITGAVPDLDAVRAKNGGREALIGEGVLEVCAAADVVFIALHGAMGENGQLQATLDNYGIKHYTGSGYIGSLLAMDKDISKRVLTMQGIPNPAWIYYDTKSDTPEKIIESVGIPCVVKPCSCGSSVGVSIIDDRGELEDALRLAAEFEDRLVVERKIVGREFSVGVLGGRTLPAIEIIPRDGFYDYKNKYQSGFTTEICPAPLTDDEAARLSKLATDVFAALRLDGYARIDCMMDEVGKVYCLEANTLPGMTPTSLLPQEAAAVGISYTELCETIALMAYNK